MPLLATLLVASTALNVQPGLRSTPTTRLPAVRAVAVAAVSSEETLLGKVAVPAVDGLVSIKPERRELAKIGKMLRFGNGGTGVIVAERCGLYFAASLDGSTPAANEQVELLPRNLTVATWDGDDASWGGLHDFLGRPEGADVASAASSDSVDVFAQPVTAAQRRPIGSSLHTGVVAIDALAPIGRGQSMMLFGPDALPAGSGRTDLALRVIGAQHQLASGVRTVLVLAEPDAALREASVARLKAAGLLEQTKVLVAKTPIEGMIAASAASSIAEACGAADVLVVIDSLRPHLTLWRAICKSLMDAKVVVSPEEEGSQQRAYYSALVERAARRKEQKDAPAGSTGGSVTLLLLQPSVSVLPAEAERKATYSLSDFESGGFTKTVCARVEMLESKGVAITEEVLVKVGIPLPGSDHPVAGKGQRSAQHLEELTSLVDGHIDLRENLASVGRVPPIDPSNSLTRIGVGSTKLRPLSSTPAMAAVSSALRLDLAAASDPGNYDEAEKVSARVSE